MSHIKAIISMTFFLALCAGIALGLLGARFPESRREGRSWLADELNLTTQQREQMRQIWSEIARPRGRDDRRKTIEKERDEALLALMTEDQRKQADLILQQYSDRVSELSREREASFEQAVAKTKEILTPAQREKYEELLKRRPDHDRDGRGGHGPSGPPPAR